MSSITRWSPSFVDNYDTFIFDCDGVIYRGTSMITGASGFVSSLLDAKKSVFFLTNAGDDDNNNNIYIYIYIIMSCIFSLILFLCLLSLSLYYIPPNHPNMNHPNLSWEE